MSTTDTYTIQGMTCGGCAGKVTAAIAEVPGVSGTDVDIATRTVTVTGTGFDDIAVRAAIVGVGYEAS